MKSLLLMFLMTKKVFLFCNCVGVDLVILLKMWVCLIFFSNCMFLIIICFNKVAFSDSNFVVTPKPNQPNSILPVPPSSNNALDPKNTNNGKIILHYNYQMVQKIVILVKYVRTYSILICLSKMKLIFLIYFFQRKKSMAIHSWQKIIHRYNKIIQIYLSLQY